MIRSTAFWAALLATLWGQASAATCEDLGYDFRLTDNRNLPNRITTALSGKRIEATAADGSGEEWNEDHCANGNLFKVGAGTPVDPRAYRGTWSISGNNQRVIYEYTVGGNLSYDWTVWINGRENRDLCWESDGVAVATAPRPGNLTGSCDAPAP